MKHSFPDVITKDTFPEAWAYTSGKLRRAKRCRVLQPLIDPIAHWAFLALFLFLFLGMLYSRLDVPTLPGFFQKAPAFVDAWNRFSREVLTAIPCPAFLSPLAWEIVICIGIAWLVPVALILPLTALVYLIYQPRQLPAPAADPQSEGAVALIGALEKIQRLGRKYRRQNSAVTSFVFLFLLGLLLCAFLFGQSVSNSALTEAIQSDHLFSLKLGGLVLGCFFLYGAVNYPLVMLMKLLCSCKVPASFTAKAENYLKSVLPEEAEKILSAPLPAEQKLWQRVRSWLTAKLLQIGFVRRFREKPMGFPVPLTAESLPDAWKWANRKLYWAKKKRVIAKAASTVVYPYFTVLLFVFVYGNLYDLKDPILSLFYRTWPILLELWEKFRPVLYANAATAQQQQTLQLVLLYGIPMAACAVIALLVMLLYHPGRYEAEISDPPETQAAKLHRLLQMAQEAAHPQKSEVRGFCHTAFASLGALFLILFIPFTQSAEAIALAGSGLLAQSEKYLVLAAAGLTLGYWVIRLPLAILIRLLTLCYVPEKALEEAESWLHLCQSSQQPPDSITETAVEKEATDHAEI